MSHKVKLLHPFLLIPFKCYASACFLSSSTLLEAAVFILVTSVVVKALRFPIAVLKDDIDSLKDVKGVTVVEEKVNSDSSDILEVLMLTILVSLAHLS